MSRNSEAKKARRRKRQAARDARWVPDEVMDTIVGEEPESEELVDSGDSGDPEADELLRAVETFDSWLTSRGWTYDEEFSGDGVATWYYDPSAAEFDDDDLEPVTRIWITHLGEENDFPHGVSAALVGTGDGDDAGSYTVAPDVLLEHIEAIEAYRPGGAVPVLG